jgi:uncharacterized membrane protein
LSSDAAQRERDRRDGVLTGLIAYTLWGLFPAYFKIVEAIPPSEVLVHRIVWAVPFGALIIHFRKQWPEVRRALANPRMLFWLGLSALFISVNWLIYIWAVQQDKIFQTSLGYYINPLIYVLVGVLFFGDRLRRLQVAAVISAGIGVAILTISGGEFPIIALSAVAVPVCDGVAILADANSAGRFRDTGSVNIGSADAGRSDYSLAIVVFCGCGKTTDFNHGRVHAVPGTDTAVLCRPLVWGTTDHAAYDLLRPYLAGRGFVLNRCNYGGQKNTGSDRARIDFRFQVARKQSYLLALRSCVSLMTSSATFCGQGA